MTSILIVDDEYTIVETLAEILSWEGYLVRTAPDGRRALIELGTAVPDLVIVDFMMPAMDGLELIDRIRTDERLRHLPVVLMSAAPISLEKRSKTWDVLLPKPFTGKAILDVIKKLAGPPTTPSSPSAC